MKQIIQNLKNGETILEEVPAPLIRKGHVLIKTHCSLVSLGTEKMLVEFGKSNLFAKARQQPEKVRQVLDKIKTEGLLPTLEAVFNKLDEPLPLGYCNAGEVIEVGEGVSEFNVGDRVVSNGPHAEFVCIPKNLCAHIPDNVSYEEASFTVIASIGLQGIRLVNPTFGETVVVIGLGLIGLITAELLIANGCQVIGFDFDDNKLAIRSSAVINPISPSQIGLITAELLIANGCQVIGFDFDDNKLALAAKKGVKAFNAGKGNDPVKTVEELTKAIGADAVVITASAKTNEVISQSAQMSRKRGRIVLVGVIGLDMNRAEFYKKELSFQVSCSYGPGRYDEDYEYRGIDYPLPFVRWTEKRNFEAILASISDKKLDVSSLITERIDLENYMQVYGNMGGKSIASILVYPAHPDTSARPSTIVRLKDLRYAESKGVIGIVGAGNFTKMTMLPALKGSGAHYKYIASAGGMTANALAKKYGFSISTTDYREILKDEEVDLVFITTRHNLHTPIMIEALKAGKHVFVEKPLAITQQQLSDLVNTVSENSFSNGKGMKSITVGFNRRFSPFVQKAKNLIGNGNTPMNIIATMNAGFIPPEVWVHDMKVGGGRIIGEACHFIDLMIYLTGSKVVSVNMSALGKSPQENSDNAIISLKFENGSQGVINYFSNGSKSYSKERIEMYTLGRTLIIDNFRKMSGYGFKGFSSMSGKQDKGHKNQFRSLIQAIQQGGNALIPFDELVNTTQASFSAIESLKSAGTINIQPINLNPGNKELPLQTLATQF